MRYLFVLLALLPITAAAQGAPPTPIKVPPVSDWIGTMEFTDYAGLNIGRTETRLLFGNDGAVTGSWRGHGGASGSIEGTFKEGRFKLKVTLRAGAERVYGNGNVETIAPERCQGDATFTGMLLRTSVIRLTTDRVSVSDEIKKARGIDCDDMRHVTWLMQPVDPIAH